MDGDSSVGAESDVGVVLLTSAAAGETFVSSFDDDSFTSISVCSSTAFVSITHPKLLQTVALSS